MHINNQPKSEKTINREGIVYALIFVLYTVILILIFSYVTNFIRYTINLALSTPASTATINKYGQLDLENYSLVAAKLGLKKSTQVKPIVIVVTKDTSSQLQIASSSLEIASTSLPEIINTPITPEVATKTPQVIEQRPNITVINSTIKSGLAADLKNKLTSVGYTVLGTSNIRPSLTNTVIKIKNSINPDSSYITEIKKIVSANYEFVLDVLGETAKSDIEIIIGNK